MSQKYRMWADGHFFFVRWYQTDVESCDAVTADFNRARAAAGRKKMVYISISSQDTPAPDDVARKRMLELIDSLVEQCSHFFVVLESSGFRGSVQPTAMAGLMLLYKNSRQIRIRATVEEALDELAKDGVIVDRSMMLQQLQSAGLRA